MINKIKIAMIASAIAAGVIVTLGLVTSFTNNVDCIITVDGPDLYQPGQLIVIDASASTATTLTWTILPHTDNFRVIGGGKAIFTSNGEEKEYTIIITGWLNGVAAQWIHTISLGYDSNIAVTELQERVISWLPVDRTTLETAKLAQAFNSIARIIENGTLNSADEIVEATAWSTSDALGDEIDKWKPFLKSLQEYLEESPPDNHAIVWREIARALEASDGAA